MSVRRGDLVTVAVKGPYTGKPRPALIVQSSDTLPHRDSVTVCLLTTDLIEAPLFRVRIEPTAGNGLKKPSDVMADKIITVPRSLLSARAFGRIGMSDLARVDAALRLWLDLA